MSDFTAAQANETLTAVETYLAANFPEFKCKMSVRRYDKRGQVSFKMEMTSVDSSDEISGSELRQRLIKQGANAEAIGFEFESQGKNYTVEDCKAWKQKFPVLARQTEDGKLYRFTASSINSRMFETKKDS